MKDFKFKDVDWGYIFDVALLIGIVLLALNNADGWGWLILVLVIRNT